MDAEGERLGSIDATRVEDGKLYVLGNRENKLGFRRLFSIVHDAETGEILQEDSFKEYFLGGVSSTGMGIFASIYSAGILTYFIFGPPFRQRRKKTAEFHEKVRQYKNANMHDLEEAVKGIRIYQGPIEEAERELGPLELVETKEPDRFLRASRTFWLRVRAYELGANAIVNFQPGSSIGTPVKYVEYK